MTDKYKAWLILLVTWGVLIALMAFSKYDPPRCQAIETVNGARTIFELNCAGAVRLEIKGDTIFIRRK